LFDLHEPRAKQYREAYFTTPRRFIASVSREFRAAAFFYGQNAALERQAGVFRCHILWLNHAKITPKHREGWRAWQKEAENRK
jgi:hypothetical protein